MHEKTKNVAEGCRPGLRRFGSGQPTGRVTWICSVGACVEATSPHVGHRRATPGAFAAAQALGLGSKRAGRRGSGVEIDIG
jgi:hypothetical protein